jgi:uncharacterized protein (DUF885 family)
LRYTKRHRPPGNFEGKLVKRILLIASTTLIPGCATPALEPAPTIPVAPAYGALVEAPAVVPEKNEQLAQLFEAYDKANLENSPMAKSYRGVRDEDYGLWDNFSDAADIADQQRLQATARTMRALFDPASLSPQDSLSYRLFDRMAQRSAAAFPFRNLGYIFNQMTGLQSQLPAFLINIHSVADVGQAEAYVSRLAGFGSVLDQLTAESRERAQRGVMPPRWVYPYVLDDIDNLLNAGSRNAILDDFREKVAKLDIPAARKADLEARAVAAWNSSGAPAYRRLRTEMVRQQSLAGTDDGVWRLPRGEAYYNTLLANYTTTDLTADQIHELGLKETQRIHGEMRAIMQQVGYDGTLQEFFEFTRTDPRFYAKSREEYLAKVDAVTEAMTAKLPEFFNTLPKDPLVVKPVEPFSEKSAGKGLLPAAGPGRVAPRDLLCESL